MTMIFDNELIARVLWEIIKDAANNGKTYSLDIYRFLKTYVWGNMKVVSIEITCYFTLLSMLLYFTIL